MKTLKSLLRAVLFVGGVASAAPTNDGLYATIQTTMGDVCFELYYTNVPRTVANFVSLAEGSRPWIDPRNGFISTKPYYNGIIFHRVITNFMIQAGSPKGDGTDGPGYTFEDEFDPALRHSRPGIVSMANSGFNSNGGQFFITVAGTPWLDDVHTVFGSVVEGMGVVSNIAAVATTSASRPLTDVTITNVFITRNGTCAQNFAVTDKLLPEVMPLPITITQTNGIKISIGTATSSYQYVYSSPNLKSWTDCASGYWTEPDGPAEIFPAIDSHGYFRAVRVSYLTDTSRPATPVGSQLTITIGSAVVRIAPDAPNSGDLEVNVDSDHMTYWEWDKTEPYRAGIYLESAKGYILRFYLHYTTPVSGRCIGYQNISGRWYYIGSNGKGTFTSL